MTVYTYPGALHIHTTYSDGSGTLSEVVAAARDAGLRWIIVTDHDTLEGRSYEGWRNDVLVVVGHEITPERNHFLALNVDGVVSRDQPPQDFIDEVYARGGFGIIAHPDEKKRNDFKDIYRWDDWSVDGPRERDGRVVGLELWNQLSDWGEHLTQRNKMLHYFVPRLGMTGPTPATLAWWDRLNMAGKRTFGVAGVDVHAIRHNAPWGQIEVFSYRYTFRTLTNYLLLDRPLSRDSEEAKHQVYAAIISGRSYFINRLDGEVPTITFEATRPGNGAQTWYCGDAPSLNARPLLMRADAGCDAFLRLIYNGRVLASGVRSLRQSVVQPGIYRLEGYRGGRPWLYTNPIYVQE